MAKFSMTSDTRARSAAKDLQAHLKALDIKSTLKHAQGIVAAMYGYAGWEDMLASLHGVADADDAAVDAATVADRHRTQIDALLAGGVPADRAETIRTALSVTARSGAENLAPVGTIGVVRQYHPHRLMEALYDKALEVTQRNGRVGDANELMSNWMGNDYRDVHEHLQNFVRSKPFLARDIAIVDVLNDDGGTFFSADFVLDESTIVDVSAMPDEKIAYPGNKFDFMTLDGVPQYIHFGPNAFPSPYFRAGIEGVYIYPSFMADDYDEEDMDELYVRFGLVVSPEYITSLTMMDQTTDMASPDRWLVENTRVAWVRADLDRDGNLKSLSADDDEGVYKDFLPFADAAVTRAMVALARRYGGSPEIGECVSSAWFPEEIARFQRARTPEQRRAVLREMGQYEGDSGVIAVWGGAVDEYNNAPEPGGNLRQEPEDLMEAIRVYAHCAEHERAWRQVHFSTLAGEMIEKLRSSEHEDADRAESWAWVNRLCLANGHSDLREYPQALEALRPIIGQHEHFFALNAIVPAMAAAILSEDKEAVATLVKDAEKLQVLYLGMHRCDRAMWAEFMGRIYLGEDVRQDVEDVVESNSLVVGSLETSRGYFEPRSLHAPGTEKSAIAIASGFSDVWAQFQAAGIAPLLEVGHKPVIH